MEARMKRKRLETEQAEDNDGVYDQSNLQTPLSQKRARFVRLDEDQSTTSDYAASTVPSLAGHTNITAIDSTAPHTETSSIISKSRPRPKKYLCTFPDCNKAYNRPIHLQTHINSHTGQRPHVCPFDDCDKSFIKSDHLNRHIRDKHGQHESQQCSYIIFDEVKGVAAPCGKTFPTEEKYKRHLARHETKEETRCGWENCGKVFRKQETLQRHIRKDHLNELPFVCTHESSDGSNCTEAFATPSLLQGHVNRCHSAPRYVCELCSGPTLDAHGSTDYGNGLDPEFLPPQFDTPEDDDDLDGIILRTLTLEESVPRGVHFSTGLVGFTTYNELAHHMKVVHPPVCAECGKQCKSSRDLTAHIDIHHPTEGSAERRAAKKVPCPHPDCPRSEPGNGFTSKGNMQTHIKQVHKAERKFVCGEFDVTGHERLPGWDGVGCGMPLVNKACLISHIRTQHLGLSGPDKKKARKSTKTSADEGMDVDGEEHTSLALSMLTGVGYEQRRPIACLIADSHGCQMRFTRDYDLGVHMELTHGWMVDDIDDAIARGKGHDQPTNFDENMNPQHDSGICLDPLLETAMVA